MQNENFLWYLEACKRRLLANHNLVNRALIKPCFKSSWEWLVSEVFFTVLVLTIAMTEPQHCNPSMQNLCSDAHLHCKVRQAMQTVLPLQTETGGPCAEYTSARMTHLDPRSRTSPLPHSAPSGVEFQARRVPAPFLGKGGRPRLAGWALRVCTILMTKLTADP
jgi:hypothetical protein